MYLLKDQQRVAKENFDTRIFLEGVAGTGKTTAAIERLKQLVRDGVRVDSILVLVPQATLAVPYREALRRSRVDVGGGIQTATLGKLAYQTVNLFFPLVAEEIGFANPQANPHFLSLELVQYYMTRFVGAEIDQKDYFNSVHISRNRLYTQIVDNLNKAALVRFDSRTIGEQLKSAWRGDVEQAYIYDDAQASADAFRQLCLDYNMLDFSLQVTLFVEHLWKKPEVRQYLTQKYRHLIVDNIEEDTPATHDILKEWLPECESVLVMYDTDGGYRRFLGADPKHAYTLKPLCEVNITLDRHRVMSDDLIALQAEMARSLRVPVAHEAPADTDARAALVYEDNTYQPQMIEWVAASVSNLVHGEGVSPKEIVILSAFLPDALKFSLQTRLNELDVPNRSHRPSRALRDEPAARTLLTLAKLAHPDWKLLVKPFDVAYALTMSIAALDLVRAKLLVDVLYRKGKLEAFETIQSEKMQERITFDLGARYDALRRWLIDYMDDDDYPLPLDAFFSKLFGEVLSQPGFGFHDQFDAANTAANFVDSAREFRQTVSKIERELDIPYEYVRMVDAGVIANQYVHDWDAERQDAVLIAPAYTFLLSNVPVDYQFWLNVGSNGWAQRLHQPLTHPYVLSRQWTPGDVWTDQHEYDADQETLSYLALGLIRRCRKQVYLGISEFGEQGFEQRGPLLMAVQRMLRRLQKEGDHV